MNKFAKIISLFCTISLLIYIPINIQVSAEQTYYVEIPNNTFLMAKPNYNTKLDSIFTSAWNNYTTKINVSTYKIKTENFISVFTYIVNEYPEYFYVNAYRYSETSGYINDVVFVYSYTEKVMTNMRNALDAECNKIIDNIDLSMSDEEILLYIHDYISTHNEYDPDGYSGDVSLVDTLSFNAYGCLVNNVSVCQGISDALKLLSDRVGIKCEMALSDAMCHAWNLVYINGKAYHLDITWDDSASDYLGFNDVKGFANHQFFLKNDAEMTALNHYNWDTSTNSTDTTYSDYYWNNVLSSIYYINGKQYYIKSKQLIERNVKTGVETALYNISNDAWSGSNGNQYVWKATTATLAYDYNSHFLVLNLGNKVVLYSLATTKTTEILTLDKGFVGGSTFFGDTLYYDLIDYSTSRTVSQNNILSFSYPEEVINFGDIDGDGNVLLNDVLLLRRYLVGLNDDLNIYQADVNIDNQINTVDILLIRKYLAGYNIELGK